MSPMIPESFSWFNALPQVEIVWLKTSTLILAIAYT